MGVLDFSTISYTYGGSYSVWDGVKYTDYNLWSNQLRPNDYKDIVCKDSQFKDYYFKLVRGDRDNSLHTKTILILEEVDDTTVTYQRQDYGILYKNGKSVQHCTCSISFFLSYLKDKGYSWYQDSSVYRIEDAHSTFYIRGGRYAQAAVKELMNNYLVQSIFNWNDDLINDSYYYAIFDDGIHRVKATKQNILLLEKNFPNQEVKFSVNPLILTFDTLPIYERTKWLAHYFLQVLRQRSWKNYILFRNGYNNRIRYEARNGSHYTPTIVEEFLINQINKGIAHHSWIITNPYHLYCDSRTLFREIINNIANSLCAGWNESIQLEQDLAHFFRKEMFTSLKMG